MNKLKLNHILTLVAIVLVLAGAYFGKQHLDDFQIRLLMMWGIYAVMVVSFNLVYGITGQFSLAHAGLAAVGAYTVAILTLPISQKEMSFLFIPIVPWLKVEWAFLPALLLGGVLAACVGFLIGAPALRLHGDYLLIVTFGFSEIIRLVLINVPSITNGAMGLKGIPNHIDLVWVTATVIVTVFVVKRLVDSSYGRAFKCIREDDIAAEAVGINLYRHKTLSFVFSSFFVGIAGGLLTEILGTIDPNVFRSSLTYAIMTMAVLGGMQSITGGIIAAAIYTVMSELLRSVEAPRIIFGLDFPGLPGLRMLAFAIMLLLLILYYRKGLMGDKEFSWQLLLSTIKKPFTKKGEGRA